MHEYSFGPANSPNFGVCASMPYRTNPFPSRRKDFEIAIICALKVERDAVEALLDEEYEIGGFSYGIAPGDQNAYTTGRISNHHVVLAYMPGIGKVSSAAVASNIRISFAGIKIAIVVGVCGGAQKTPDGEEILLGDVVISEAVIQVDFGRQYPEKFITKDALDNLGRANPQIRSFVGRASGWRVRQRLITKTDSYSAELCQMHGFQNVSYPGIENDRLYTARYRHKHHLPDACDICDRCQSDDDEICEAARMASCTDLGCDDRQLIPRARAELPRELAIHFGRIASGDGVMKSGQHRDEIVAGQKVIAFEMEGAGAWDYLPTVIIKSVCDYADSHKSKEWQRYAAITAAACTKAFLEEWRSEDRPPEKLDSLEMCYKSPKEDLLAYVPEAADAPFDYDRLWRDQLGKPVRLDDPKSLKTYCLLSLSFPNIDSRRHNIRSAHQDTCGWLYSTNEFRQWQKRDHFESYNGVLWIKGKPGAGKSTLMKHALLHCQRFFSNYAIAAYFFNARGDTLEKSPLGMLRSLVFQLLDQIPQFYEFFRPRFLDNLKKHGNKISWHPTELKDFLLDMMKRHQTKPILIFVDALDECDESQVRDVVTFLDDISSAAIESDSSLNICLSSRHYPTITMDKLLELVLEEVAGHDNDISIYVHDRLRVQDDVIERELLRKASGVFMWVILVIEILNQTFEEGRIIAMRNKLQEVPSGLDEVFRTLLEKDNPYKHETILMLQLILFARRRLNPKELYFAVLAGSQPTALQPWDPSTITDQLIKRFIINTSRGLVEVIEGPGKHQLPQKTVQFIHESVNDFLLRNRRLQTLDAALIPHVVGVSHDRLKACCLSYIEMGLSASLLQDIPPEDKLARYYPFLDYATTHILEHAEQAHLDCIAQHDFVHRLHHDSDLVKGWTTFHDVFTEKKKKYGPNTNLLSVLSFHHFQGLMQALLLVPGVDVNAQGGQYANALQAAAAGFNNDPAVTIEVMQTLLDAGADVNADGGYYGNALHAVVGSFPASNPVTKEIVQMLLDAGADVDAGITAGVVNRAVEFKELEYHNTIHGDGDDNDYGRETYLKTAIRLVLYPCQRLWTAAERLKQILAPKKQKTD